MELTGNLLIAPPTVKNNFWHKTVIFITEHHAHGSVGLVLNKRSPMSIAEFGQNLGLSLDMPGFIYVGGPVNPKNLTVLHSAEWHCSNTLSVNHNFSLSSSNDMMARIAHGDRPEYFRIFMGLSGWAPGQLMSEILGTPPWVHENSWLITKSDTDLIFGSDHHDQWCSAIDKCGSEFAQKLLA